MMRLGLVTPLDMQSTGVAEYSLDLLPHLAQTAVAALHVFGSENGAPAEGDGWILHAVSDLPRMLPDLDLLIYQMGNSPAHDFMSEVVQRYSGLLVLHDLSLHDFFARQTARHPARYMRAAAFGYGREGLALARRYLRQAMPVGYPQYLFSEELAARHLAVIVHSRHAAEILRTRCALASIRSVPMPMPLPARRAMRECRAELGLADDVYLIAVFGVLNESKHPFAILDALRRLRADGISAHAVFIGKQTGGYMLAPDVTQRGLDAHVTQLGFVPTAEAQHWMFAADVAVGLRQLYFGETSSSALRVLATGTPMIVTRVGAFDELPDAVCIKLAPDDPDVAIALYATLRQLHADPERRKSMGDAAREYIARLHDPAQVAKVYLEVVRSVLDGVE